MRLILKVRTDETRRTLDRLAKRGVPWATKNALDWVAERLQRQTTLRLNRQFTIRTDWVPKGIRMGRASTKNLTSRVYVAPGSEKFMQRHALGGLKDPKDDWQGVPAKGGEIKGIGTPRGASNEKTTMRRSGSWPGSMVERIARAQERAKAAKTKRKSRSKIIRGSLFVIRKPSAQYIMQRIASGKGTGRLRVLWFLTRADVKIPKRWDFYEFGDRFVPRVFPRLFEVALEQEARNLRA